MGNERRLAVHPDAVHHRGVALRNETRGNRPGLLGYLVKGKPRPDDLDIVTDLIERHLVEHFLLRRRTAGPAVEGAGKVGEVTEASDRVGIKRQELARSYPPP